MLSGAADTDIAESGASIEVKTANNAAILTSDLIFMC
jgi:hypothetical protein